MKYSKIFFTILATALLVSCSDDIPVPSDANLSARPDCPTVNIPLNIEIASEESFHSSRAVEDSETGVDATIHDVWVLQFERSDVASTSSKNDAVDDNAHLVYWDYIPDFDPSDPAKSTVTLAESIHPCAILIFANTLDPNFGSKCNLKLTLRDVKQWEVNFYGYSDLFSQCGAMDDSQPFPENADHAIRFNGITPMPEGIGAATPSISVPLKRDIARIDVNIIIGDNLKSTDVDFTIDDLTLCNVPDISYRFTNGNWSDEFTNGRHEFVNSDGSLNNYPRRCTFNFRDIAPIEGAAVPVPAGVDRKLRFYVPANQRGKALVAPSLTGERDKPLSAVYGATYLRMKAHYKENDELCTRTYTFYLGENLGERDSHDPAFLHDFNIIANHAYSYTLTFNSLGDAAADSRVEEYGSVTFPTDEFANCYILNPSDNPGYSRRFNIPVGRVDEFWGDSNLGNESNNCLSTGNEWFVDIVWSDFNIDDFNASHPEGDQFELVVDEGFGKDQYFSVKVPAGLSGNVVVGSRKKSGEIVSEYLWSWHLWITDYNPDKTVTKAANTYLYPVPGGNVCRMAGDDWDTGVYKDAFMMDRYLGATSRPEPEYRADSSTCGLVYEYGRKDPFKVGTVYLGGNNQTSIINLFYNNYYGSSKATEISQDSYLFSIANPMIKYLDAIKLNGNTNFQPTDYHNYVLHDTRVRQSEYPESGQKSIFDPSPLGWITPDERAFSDTGIDNELKISSETGHLRGMPLRNPNMDPMVEDNYFGAAYWPYVDPWMEQVPESIIYFHTIPWLRADWAGNGISESMWITNFIRPHWAGASMYPCIFSVVSGTKSYASHVRGSAIRCVKLPKH